MAIQQRLGLSTRLTQRLILTPALQQAIKLLPLTILELAEVLEQEMIENPVLEEAPAEETGAEDDAASSAEAEKTEEGEGETALDSPKTEDASDDEREASDKNALDEIDVEKFFEDYFEDRDLRRLTAETETPEAPPIENTLAETPDLVDHLLWQLRMAIADERTMLIGDAIIQNLDEDGLLRVDLDEIAQAGGFSREEVERVLQIIQGLDPSGVAARDVSECLRLQLKHLGLEGCAADVMVRDHLKSLRNHQYAEIGRLMSLTPEEVAHHIEIIKHLDPKPGLKYSATRSHYITPDVFVQKEGDEYKIALNDDGLPRLRVNPTYVEMLRKPGSEDARSYVKEKLKSAHWLLKSVDQRQRTIFKVATSIVHHQRAFLDNGIAHLRPLVLRDVANDIGMHESTVSRVVANKYMHTPRGVYEMRFFFHSGIASNMGGTVSSMSIKDKIKQMISQEDGCRPLSDSQIAAQLRSEGIPLARRTIAKYREEMKVPPSNLRRSC